MIEITLYHLHREDPGDQMRFIGYEISGHAGYADYGQDIVCASVSVLAIHTANALDELTDNEMDIEMDEDGYLKVMHRANGLNLGLDSFGDMLMQALAMSIMNTYEAYSNEDEANEFINIKFEEV